MNKSNMSRKIKKSEDVKIIEKRLNGGDEERNKMKKREEEKEREFN